MKEEAILVSIIMGSDSDMKIMEEAVHIIKSFNISYEVDIVSAHRTPEKLYSFAKNAHVRGVKVIIAGAGLNRLIPLTVGIQFCLFYKCPGAFLWLQLH